VPGTFALPAGPASPAAARARPQPPPPRARRTPRPRQGQVRRACREAGPPAGVAELNCSGFGGPVGVPDRVRNTKLTYPIPPRISPRHAAPADGRPASRTPGPPPRAGGGRTRKRPDRWPPEVPVGASVTECSIWPIPRESFDKRATAPNGGYFACSGSAADAERDCRGRPDSWHGGLTNEPGPLPGSRNLANHGAPIDAYYATSRQAKVRLCARDGSATGYAGSVHIMHSGVLPAAKRAAITPAPPLSPDGLPAPSRTRITAAAGTVPAAGRDDGAFRPGRR